MLSGTTLSLNADICSSRGNCLILLGSRSSSATQNSNYHQNNQHNKCNSCVNDVFRLHISSIRGIPCRIGLHRGHTRRRSSIQICIDHQSALGRRALVSLGSHLKSVQILRQDIATCALVNWRVASSKAVSL